MDAIIVYTANFCPTCIEVEKFLHSVKVEHEIINTDLQDTEPPIPVMVYPALFINNELVAYGTDIKKALNSYA